LHVNRLASQLGEALPVYLLKNIEVEDPRLFNECEPANIPSSDGKGSLYEGGTRVVAFASWPATSRKAAP
jgi:hypothetical protein